MMYWVYLIWFDFKYDDVSNVFFYSNDHGYSKRNACHRVAIFDRSGVLVVIHQVIPSEPRKSGVQRSEAVNILMHDQQFQCVCVRCLYHKFQQLGKLLINILKIVSLSNTMFNNMLITANSCLVIVTHGAAQPTNTHSRFPILYPSTKIKYLHQPAWTMNQPSQNTSSCSF